MYNEKNRDYFLWSRDFSLLQTLQIEKKIVLLQTKFSKETKINNKNTIKH